MVLQLKYHDQKLILLICFLLSVISFIISVIYNFELMLNLSAVCMYFLGGGLFCIDEDGI